MGWTHVLRRSFAGAIVGTMVMTISAGARADDSAHQQAVAAFQEGRRLIEQGNCDAAIPKLKESLAHEASVGARLSIADCVERDDPLYAWRVLEDAAALALTNHDERVSIASERAAALQSRLAMIVFKLPAASEEAGFELRIDGALVDRYLYRAGYATTPGQHRVVASAPGRRFTASVVTQIGAQATLEVELENDAVRTPAVPPPVTSPPPEADRGGGRRTLGLAASGIGLAGIATGVVFGILTLQDRSQIERQCGGSLASCTAPAGSVDAQAESAKTNAAISTVSVIVGGTALVGGAALYLTAPSTGGSKTGIRVSPRASLRGAGVGLEGSW